ncbi:hypothetical protein SKAU_G00180240 [Synaphobranchus kaupii]|uniref:Uncharacterized protein n=1 Tax=Synaphobranchus kaupii TaxID=118154 RepID=A0A9Q1IZG2_SYNKA|nr:hypothetical protein SKAU_G00180240 [Synaphobranchus kaupii]
MASDGTSVFTETETEVSLPPAASRNAERSRSQNASDRRRPPVAAGRRCLGAGLGPSEPVALSGCSSVEFLDGSGSSSAYGGCGDDLAPARTEAAGFGRKLTRSWSDPSGLHIPRTWLWKAELGMETLPPDQTVSAAVMAAPSHGGVRSGAPPQGKRVRIATPVCTAGRSLQPPPCPSGAGCDPSRRCHCGGKGGRSCSERPGADRSTDGSRKVLARDGTSSKPPLGRPGGSPRSTFVRNKRERSTVLVRRYKKNNRWMSKPVCAGTRAIVMALPSGRMAAKIGDAPSRRSRPNSFYASRALAGITRFQDRQLLFPGAKLLKVG